MLDWSYTRDGSTILKGAVMGQAIRGKGVVVGKAAATLRRALAEPKADPQKIKKLEEALQFHREVKEIS